MVGDEEVLLVITDGRAGENPSSAHEVACATGKNDTATEVFSDTEVVASAEETGVNSNSEDEVINH